MKVVRDQESGIRSGTMAPGYWLPTPEMGVGT